MLNEISLSKFLSRFCNLTGKDLTKLHHEEVKFLFPQLKRATFEEINNNPALLTNGNILLVDDGIKTIPYYVPQTLENGNEECYEFVMQKVEEVAIDYSRHDYTKMSVYELRCLLKRKFNSTMNQKYARRELQNRGFVLSKKYDRCAEKRKRKRLENEEY